MMRKQVECPTCGNEIIAKSEPKVQKCQFCRRLFTVDITLRGKRSFWNVECKDFDGVYKKIERKSRKE